MYHSLDDAHLATVVKVNKPHRKKMAPNMASNTPPRVLMGLVCSIRYWAEEQRGVGGVL